MKYTNFAVMAGMAAVLIGGLAAAGAQSVAAQMSTQTGGAGGSMTAADLANIKLHVEAAKKAADKISSSDTKEAVMDAISAIEAIQAAMGGNATGAMGGNATGAMNSTK
jgi:uncharacterized protein YggE